MYVEGTTDLMGMIMYLPFQPADTKEKNLALIIERATTRYFPVYEKVSDESRVVHNDSKVGTGSPLLHSTGPTHHFPEGKLQYNSGTVWWSQHSAKRKGPQNNIQLVSVLSIFAVFFKRTPQRADPTF